MKWNPALIIILFFVLTACDWQAEVIVVSSQRTDTLAVMTWDDNEFGPVTDSMVYDDLYSRSDVMLPTKAQMITLPNRKFKYAPDSKMIDLYIFSLDTATKYQQLKLMSGILKRALLKKITIQANTIKEPVDTIYIK
ncbi:hypothetical protein [Mucilaginibacter sp. HD30]